MEHSRLVRSFSPQDTLCDMTCGIGPFAIPAALRGCTVHANDLNPASIRWLRHNIAANKVGARVTPYVRRGLLLRCGV